MSNKTCSRCHVSKPEEKFKLSGNGVRGPTCNQCIWDARKARGATGHAERDADMPKAAKAATGGVQDEDDKAYWFDSGRQTYVFTDARITLPKDTVDNLVADYSWVEGKGLTLNEIARKYGMSRSTIRDVIKALGKTHDSLGYTDEVISETDEDALMEDQVRKKEQRIIVRAEKERWSQIKKMAERAERWETFVFSRIEEMPVPPIPKPAKLKAIEKQQGNLCTYVGLQDLHIGGYSWSGETGVDGNTVKTRERVMDTLASAIARVRRFGEIGQVILPCGGDFFHIDTPAKTTTKLTPQDTDGSFAKIMVDGFAIAAEIVNYLAQASTQVQVLNSAGNHDNTLSLVLLKWLEVAYKGRSDVQVRADLRTRQYYRHGNSLIGVTHGDGPKDQKLPMLMATEAPQDWAASKFRYWFSGHFHTQFSNEFYGVQVHHHSSLKGTDKWHYDQGYVGNVVGMNMYVIDEQDGMLAHMPIAAKV